MVSDLYFFLFDKLMEYIFDFEDGGKCMRCLEYLYCQLIGFILNVF